MGIIILSVICVATLVGIIMMFRHFRKVSAVTKATILIVTSVLTLVFLFSLWFLLLFIFGTSQFASRVDISPIERVTEAQMEFLEDVAMQIKNHPSIHDVGSLRELSNSTRYWIRWNEGYSAPRRLRVEVRIYDNDRSAIQSIERGRPGRFEPNQMYREIVNDNNTGAILRHCTNNSTFSVMERYLISYVRIGNVVFRFGEVRPVYGLSNGYSNQFIELFVELLEEAQLAQNGE